MKRISFYLILMILSLSMIGCTSNKKEGQNQITNSNKKQEKKYDKKSDTIEDLLNNPIVKSQLEKMMTKELTISAEGNNLIYAHKQPEQIEVNEEVIKVLKKGVSQQEESFKSMGQKFLKDVDANEIKIILKYTNADDSEIYTHEIICKN